MKLYLVINVSDEEEVYLVDICKTKEVAELLVNEYIENYREYRNLDASEYFKILEIDPESKVDILWTAYPNDTVPNITYLSNEQFNS